MHFGLNPQSSPLDEFLIKVGTRWKKSRLQHITHGGPIVNCEVLWSFHPHINRYCVVESYNICWQRKVLVVEQSLLIVNVKCIISQSSKHWKWLTWSLKDLLKKHYPFMIYLNSSKLHLNSKMSSQITHLSITCGRCLPSFSSSLNRTLNS